MYGKKWILRNGVGVWEGEHNLFVYIHSQEELEAVQEDYTGDININFGTEEKRAVLDRELSARIYVFCDSVIEIRKPNIVHAVGDSIVYAWNKDKVRKVDNAKVYNLEED